MSIKNMLLGTHSLLNAYNTKGAPAHNGITASDIHKLSSSAGSEIVRIPLDLSIVGPNGLPSWAVKNIAAELQQLQQFGIKVIFQPGQTPRDLSQTGAVDGSPRIDAIDELAARFAVFVKTIHESLSQYSDVIAGWEVGNEPNLSYRYTGTYYSGKGDPNHDRFYAVSVENAEYYARYLHAVNETVKGVENSLGQNIKVIGAGIAHNDYAYMDTMFATLKHLGADIEGFTIHPYTIYDYNATSPQSGRPTDWVPNPVDTPSAWNYYHSFQGALHSIQFLKDYHGFEGAELWITEFGVPSYTGYRGAGLAGEIDQANFIAEAIGVLDSWDNTDLKGIMAHMVLDNYYRETNDGYNAYDGNRANDGSTSIGEGSFGLFGRYADRTIYAKPVVGFLRAVTAGVDYSDPSIRILNVVSSDITDLSRSGSNGVGYLNGYIAMTNDGNDTVNGSRFDDSLFAGNGADTVNGNAGADRIYGGQGNDLISGNDGDDDLYGNTGDDTLNGGAGSNRIDGGTGWDTLVLDGSSGSYGWSGNGRHVTVSANNRSQFTTAINIEAIYFTDDYVTVLLPDADTSRGNGSVSNTSHAATPPAPENDLVQVAAGGSITFDVLGNDSDPDSDRLTITRIGNVDMQPGWQTWVAEASGLIIYNADGTLTYRPSGSASGTQIFTYTVSDGAETATATVTAIIIPTAPSPVDNYAAITPGSSVTIDVLANDRDPNGDALTITQINGVDMQPGWQTWVADADGLVIYNADGTLTYQPSGSASGIKSFSYTVSDGNETATAIVSIDLSRAVKRAIMGHSFSSGQGDDVFFGTDGHDTFFFTNAQTGRDIIHGFETGAGSNDILVFDTALFADLNSLVAAASDNGLDTTVSIDGDTSIIVKGRVLSDFHYSDVMFF